MTTPSPADQISFFIDVMRQPPGKTGLHLNGLDNTSKARIYILGLEVGTSTTVPKRQHADVASKKPQQKRSAANVAAILQASTRVLEREGLGGFNTNRIAEKAGVGVGTLYQFFRSKEAILVAIARHQLEADRAVIMSALAPVIDDPNAPIERVVIRAVIDTYRRHTTTRKLVMQTMIGLGLSAEVTAPARSVAGLLADRIAKLPGGRRPALTAARIFIVTCAVEAAIRAAAYDGLPFFGTQEFEDELVQLVRSFLAAPAGGAIGSRG